MDPKTEQHILERLFRYGYFRAGFGNPIPDEAKALHKRNSWNVTRNDLPNLMLKDPEAQEAIATHQAVFRDFLDQDAEAFYGRAIHVDGQVGTITAHHILDVPRCDCPDFDVNDDEEPDDQAKWNRVNANWPDHCRFKLVFGREFPSLPGLTTADTNAVWWAACNNWTAAVADIVMDALEATADAADADIWANLQNLRGSTLAWSQLARNRCDVTLAQAYDRRTWGKGQAAATATHEVGHALGLNHITGRRQEEREATMFPSITRATISRRGWPNEADRAQVKRLGYEVEREPRQPKGDELWRPRDEPKPPPRPDGPDWEGMITIKYDGDGTRHEQITLYDPPAPGHTFQGVIRRVNV